MKGILARLDKRKEVQRHQSTRQLMGISSNTDHGVSTPYGDYTFFLIRPDNLSVLSEDAIRQRVGNLANLLSNRDEVTIMALDSRASFQHNKLFYQARLEEETEPAIRRTFSWVSTCMVYPRAPEVRGIMVILWTGAESFWLAATRAWPISW